MEHEQANPATDTRRFRFLLPLLVVFGVGAMVLLGLAVLSRFGATHEPRPSAKLGIDLALSSLHDHPQFAADMLARSTRSINSPLATKDPKRTLGLIWNSDETRMLVLYYTQTDEFNPPVVHSAELIDMVARTTTWPLLDPEKMSEYMYAAAAQLDTSPKGGVR